MTDTPKLYRVIVQVTDLDAAVTFYSTLMNLKGRLIRGNRCYFDCGDVIVALLDPTPGGITPRPNPGCFYFSVSDLEAIHERARTLGCLSDAIERVHDQSGADIVVRPWGERSFYAHDPFGNELCFVDEKTLFRG